MNSIFDRYNLNTFERRLIIGVFLGIFIVVNLMFVVPKFREWGEVRDQRESAQQKLRIYQTVLNKRDGLEKQLEKLDKSGMKVFPEERSSELFELIQQKLRKSNLPVTALQRNRPAGNIRSPKEKFFEQETYSLNFNTNYKQLRDFLVAIGSDEDLMIHVGRLQLASAGHHLNCKITLVANYQPQPSGNSSVQRKQ